MRFSVFVLSMLIATGACQAQGTTTQAAATQPTTRRADVEATDAFIAFLAASVARDREKLQELVLLPTDEERRQWVLKGIGTGEFPPPGVKFLSMTVKMEGPVAVGQVTYEMPDGSPKTSVPGFLVHRDGAWKVVVDFFEGGGLTEEEMQIISEYFGQR